MSLRTAEFTIRQNGKILTFTIKKNVKIFAS